MARRFRAMRADLRPSLRIILLIALGLLLAGAAVVGIRQARVPHERPVLGLFTTLPIYWGEARELSDLLAKDREQHWVRRDLEEGYVLRPLDVLEAEKPGSGLAGLRFLLMAQPRALSPAENVSLDAWVRAGGRLLLFADPMLTEESSFAVGDKRRPHDVVLLSPILAHWGLDLQFDEQQDEGVRTAGVFGTEMPINLYGRLALLPQGSAGARCTITSQGLVAQCAIGQGRATIVADAALLESNSAQSQQAGTALAALIRAAFAPD